jgi:hypothetical protein
MVVVGNQAREDSQDGELGVNDQQLGNQAVDGEQPEEAEEEEKPQGNSNEENPEGDGVQDDQQEEEEAGAQESSGVAGMGPFSPDLKARVKQLEKLLADLVAGKMKPATSFQGVKLRPADPPKYAGGKQRCDQGLASHDGTVVRLWNVCSRIEGRPCPDLFDRRSSQSWRAKSAVLQAQSLGCLCQDPGAGIWSPGSGAECKEQVGCLEKQTSLVEDFANKFLSLVAEIVAMPLSEGDLLQKFKNGLKPDIQMVASIDPVTGTRWMNLQKFISFACATDASRAHANKSKQASDKSEQGKSSSSGAGYKDKLKAKRPNEPSTGQLAKKPKTGLERQKSD